MAMEEGIEIATVRVIDDVAAMPPERMHERRGIGGAFFQVKVAGAACATAQSVSEAKAIVEMTAQHPHHSGLQ